MQLKKQSASTNRRTAFKFVNKGGVSGFVDTTTGSTLPCATTTIIPTISQTCPTT